MNDYFKKWCCLILFNPSYQHAMHLNSISSELDCAKHLYFFKETTEIGKGEIGAYQTHLISSNSLQTEMRTAFENAFSLGFRKVVLIKSNFEQIEAQQLTEAFNCLKMIEFSIGPTADGDYYLIGMNYFEPSLFEPNKLIHSSSQLKNIISEIGKLKLATYKLKTY